MKALEGVFNQEKALVGAFPVIVKTGCGTDGALHSTNSDKFVSRPYFGDAETSVTVQQGEAAFFNCHVFNLANQTVGGLQSFFYSIIYRPFNYKVVVILSAGWARKNSYYGEHFYLSLNFLL